MQRRYNLAHLILASVVVLGLTPLIVVVDAQARIAFASNRDGHFNYEIYVMDADGGNPQNLTNSPRYDRDPSWSPDGKRIAFMSDRDGHVINGFPSYEIYVMDADGRNPQNLTNHPNSDENPSWSPDGKRIAFDSFRDGNRDIYVMDVDGGNQRRLTKNPFKDWEPTWSPDGKRIVFVSDREVDGNHEVHLINADGNNPRNLTNHAGDDTDPAWFDPAFAVTPTGKILTIWERLKQVDR